MRLTPQQERFCQFVVMGCGSGAAAVLAGLDQHNGSRVRKLPQIAARIAQIRETIARQIGANVRSLILEIEGAAAAARAAGKYEAAVSALTAKAMVCGLIPPLGQGRKSKLASLTLDDAVARGYGMIFPPLPAKLPNRKTSNSGGKTFGQRSVHGLDDGAAKKAKAAAWMRAYKARKRAEARAAKISAKAAAEEAAFAAFDWDAARRGATG